MEKINGKMTTYVPNVVVKKEVKETSKKDVNLDKVNEIKEKIKNKTFTVNPEAIANKMLEDKETVKNLLK